MSVKKRNRAFIGKVILTFFNFINVGIDECISQPCQNNGTCVDQHNGYKCFCLSGDFGQNCIMRK